MYKKLKAFVTGKNISNETHTLRIPRLNERQGILALGDTGSGKTVLIQDLISQARATDRREPGVCFDPASELVTTHYREGLDFILNPLDERFPNWALADEIKTVSDLDLVAESFIPTKYITGDKRFFSVAAKDVFKKVLAQRCTTREMIAILSDEVAIDNLLRGTPTAHKIKKEGGPQRAGVLATLADVAKALENIPPRSKDKRDFCLTDWTREKIDGWIFLTATPETADALNPLISAMLNLLMARLMSVPEKRVCWFVADEIHNLNSLSALPKFMVECRKHKVCYIFGTQSKYQLIDNYGETANTMLASPILKLFYRCNEPKAAQWISDFIGQADHEKLRVSTSVPDDRDGKASTNFSTVVETRSVISKEQVMHLPDLNAYWKFGGMVVPFRMDYVKWAKKHPGFIPRMIDFPQAKQVQKTDSKSDAATPVNPAVQSGAADAGDKSNGKSERSKPNYEVDIDF